jgi:membrane protein DedA with SNARE-associated domain
MIDQLLSLLTTYGMPALFGILMISSIGAPFPVMFVLIAAGSFVTQGEMKLWEVLCFACAGAMAGDQIGYATGRWGGRDLVHRLTARIGAQDRIKRAEALNHRWGGAAVFFTRWLLTPLGPWLNLTSGFTGYPWPRFLLWDALGEAIWVVLYVMLGKAFSDQVQGLADLFGSLSWVLVGIIVSIILGWKVLLYFRTAKG